MSDAVLAHADYAREARFSADVVVVGTGAGGGSLGAELAEAGLSVIFVEEGSYHRTESFNPYATETVPRLYRDASTTLLFGTPDIPYLEGRCVGGSTVLNGGMAYRPPEHVLDGWQRQTGEAELGARGLDPLFAHVERRVSAAQQLELSVGQGSRLLVEGARRFGWRVELNPRNQVKCVGSNQCVFGCPTGAKQSTLVSYLPSAFEHGARCLTEVRISEIVIERGRAVGVRGRAIDPRTRRPSHRVEVRARAVVVAAGAVQTPYLLLGHRLGRASGLLGKNLTCHPNVKVLAVYPHDVMHWQGVNQYAQIREFHDEGIVMAENMVPPAAIAALIPRVGAAAWDLMKDYHRIMATGVLVEDSSTGSVARGPLGMAFPRYDVTDLDHARFIKGAKLLSQLHFEMGARYVVLPFARRTVAHSADELASIDERSVPKTDLEILTVHLMGTAALGAHAARSVVNLSGELWDLPGCYVADASLFPTAIAVNPQITIMALATRVAQRLAERVQRDRARDGRARAAATV